MTMSADDATTRPLKRARLSPEADSSSSSLHPSQGPSAPSLNRLERHPELWFDDGNIILIAQQTGFRIFRGLLAVQSTVFADMFAAASSQPDETLDGCPVVHLTDSHPDLAHLLRILLPASPVCYPASKSEVVRSFDEVSAVVRLAHKYHIQSVLDQAIRALQEYPLTHDFDDLFPPPKQHIAIHGPQYIGAMTLARLTDTPLMLPYALYQCSLLGGNLLDGWKREDGTVERLCTADIQRCFDGHIAVEREQCFLIHRLFAPVPSGRCMELGSCTPSLERFARNAVEISKLEKPVFFDWAPSIQTVHSLCEVCKEVLIERNQAECQRIWDSLPEMFGLAVEGWAHSNDGDLEDTD